jgi:hypothetical protein
MAVLKETSRHSTALVAGRAGDGDILLLHRHADSFDRCALYSLGGVVLRGREINSARGVDQ